MLYDNCNPKWLTIIGKLLWLVVLVLALAYELQHNDWHATIWVIIAGFLSIGLVMCKQQYCEIKQDYVRIRQEALTANAEVKKLSDQMLKEKNITVVRKV